MAAASTADQVNADAFQRIVIISTPRSGNTWLRRLLSTLFALENRAVHHPDEIDWAHLPPRVLLQIHWRRVEPFASLLKQHQFRVVVISRHPLDVLISILHFAPTEPETNLWLSGEGGSEGGILAASPVSPAFLEYACGSRAAALLAVSPEWWRAPGSIRVRYEDLLADAHGELKRIANELGCPMPPDAVAAAIEANTLERLRVLWANQHIWHGRSYLWRCLLPAREAREIAAVQAESFRVLESACDPDENLTPEQAAKNWALLS